MADQPNKFYLTTPIYYVNARPHIGHAYTTIVADVLARRHRLLGEDTFFLTGTDEHGQKIERSAAAAGEQPQQFADRVSAQFKALWDRMGLTYDGYIRTTAGCHKQGVQKLFETLWNKGFIYLDKYTGAYCVSDEAFVDAPVGTPCPDCGRLLEEVTEENFFFRLSAFQEKLIALIESNELLIEPATARNEVLSFVRGGLKDLSVSRSSFTWGIPVPEAVQKAAGATQKHVVYVWLDALTNYMTAVGYGSDEGKDKASFAKWWPADLHLVGKEITRFHCVYWPAFLMAAELPLPKRITANGWLLFDNAKMSKSKGNVVRTETILEAFGEHVYAKQFPDSTKRERDLFAADVLRYFLLREIPFGQDGSFSFDSLVTRYNADLANGYGNLVSRVLNLIYQNQSGVIEKAPRPWLFESTKALVKSGTPRTLGEAYSGTETIIRAVHGLGINAKESLDQSRFDIFVGRVSLIIGIVDTYLTEHAPWKLAKSTDPLDRQKLTEVLYTAVESIRVITSYLYPFMPSTTAKVWAQLGLSDIEVAARSGELGGKLAWGHMEPGTKLGALAPIFPRADKGLAQIMIDMENPTPQQDEPKDPKHPAAAPRAIEAPAGTLPVAGSTSEAPRLEPTPPHTEAPASGVFAAEAQKAAAPEGVAQITIDDFAKVEMRVAQIKVAERIPKADKLLRLEVDLGTEQRQILSGIAEWYTPEELIGRKIVVITNLAPRKMRGLESHGMLLAASEEGGKPVLATFGEEIAVGARLK